MMAALSGLEETAIEPPAASTIRWTVARPRWLPGSPCPGDAGKRLEQSGPGAGSDAGTGVLDVSRQTPSLNRVEPYPLHWPGDRGTPRKGR